MADAAVVSRQPGVLAGLPVALAVLDAAGLPPGAAQPLCADGDRVRPGTAVLRIQGPLRELLGAERTLLNFVTHLSGIATLTRAWADQLAGHGGPAARHPEDHARPAAAGEVRGPLRWGQQSPDGTG